MWCVQVGQAKDSSLTDQLINYLMGDSDGMPKVTAQQAAPFQVFYYQLPSIFYPVPSEWLYVTVLMSLLLFSLPRMPNTCSVCIWLCSSTGRLPAPPSSSPERSSAQVQTFALNKKDLYQQHCYTPHRNHVILMSVPITQEITEMPITCCSACTQSCKPKRLRSLLRWPPIWWSSTPIF